MKLLILLIISFFAADGLYAQLTGNLFGTPYSFDIPHSSGSYSGGNNRESHWQGSNQASGYSAPTSSQTITNAYTSFAWKAAGKAANAWRSRDWNKAIHFYRKALAYDEGNTGYKNAIRMASGYREWDKGVSEAKKKNWEGAISRYKEGLTYLPEEKTLKDNIIACSFNQSLEAAEAAYNKGDYVEAAVYYNVLWKNFGESGAYVQSRYSDCMSRISQMPASSQAYARLDARLEAVKQKLPFVSNGW